MAEPNAMDKRPEPPKPIKKRVITIDTSEETVLQWNADGDTMYFMDDPEMFKELSPAAEAKLSALNKTKYQLARDTMRRLQKRDPEMDEVSKRIKVGATQAGMGSMATRFFGNKPRGGLAARVARADNVSYWEQKGYRLAKEGDLVEAGMPFRDGYYGIASQGVTTNVVMVTDGETKKANQQARDDLNKAVLGKATEGEAIARSTGYGTFTEK